MSAKKGKQKIDEKASAFRLLRDVVAGKSRNGQNLNIIGYVYV